MKNGSWREQILIGQFLSFTGNTNLIKYFIGMGILTYLQFPYIHFALIITLISGQVMNTNKFMIIFVNIY